MLVESIGKFYYWLEEDFVGFDIEYIFMMVVDGVGMVWVSICKEDECILGLGCMLGDYIGLGNSKYIDYDEVVVVCIKLWFEDWNGEEDLWCFYVGLVVLYFLLVVF